MLEKTIQELTEAVAGLTAALQQAQGSDTVERRAPAKKSESEAPKTSKAPAKKAAAKKPDPEPEVEVAAEEEDGWDDADDEQGAEPEYTAEDVRKAVAPLGPKRGKPLLKKHAGVESLKEVAPEHFAAVIKAAEEARKA